jgi:hypothetical protein
MKKKIAGLICAIASVALIASCGGGTSAAQSAINSSASALSDIIDYMFNTCVDFPCACPGGGTVDYDGTTITADGCKASNGETFTGTLTDNVQLLAARSMEYRRIIAAEHSRVLARMKASPVP